jgi:uncharacterized membrane protein
MPSLVETYFSDADFDAIEAAVRKAEQTTAAEIVIRLVSDVRNWRLERTICSVVVALIVATATLLLLREENWGVYYDITQAMPYGLGGFVLAYFALNPLLRSESRRHKHVWNRSVALFEQFDPTRDLTAVLIVVALREHMVVVLGDKTIVSQLPDDYWQKLHATIVSQMKQGNHAEGIIKGIELISPDLARLFPPREDDINELPDRPVDSD